MNPSAVDAGCWNCQKTVEVASKEGGVVVDERKMEEVCCGWESVGVSSEGRLGRCTG